MKNSQFSKGCMGHKSKDNFFIYIYKKAALKFLGLFRSKYNTNRSTGTHIYFITIANSSVTSFFFSF